MDLEPVDALKAAGIPEDRARVFMDSLRRDLDKRYGISGGQVVTRGEFAEAIAGLKVSIAEVKTTIAEVRTEISDSKAELIKWFLGSMIAMTAVVLTAIRFAGR
jgi:hypothetical protein